MNLLNRIMSYDKTKNENQEKCNCAECLGNAEISKKTEIIGNFEYADDFLIKVENYRLMRREYEILNTINTEHWYKDVKTKNFIWKSLHVHGDKYIYHKTKYIRYEEKVEITCRVKSIIVHLKCHLIVIYKVKVVYYVVLQKVKLPLEIG